MFEVESIVENYGRSLFRSNTPILINSNHQTKTYTGYHTHDFFEFVYVVDGIATHTTPLMENEIKQGDYFIININTPHQYIGNIVVLNCLFYPEFLDKSLADHTNFNDLLNNYLIKFHFNELSYSPVEKIFHDDDGSVLNLLHTMKNELTGRLPGYLEVTRSLLIQILINTLRKVYSYSSPQKSKIIEQCMYEIDTDFRNEFQLNQFCRKHHYDPSYLGRKFKREVGVSCIKYQQRVKMTEACRLLTNTELKVSDIAASIGYKDMKHFFRIFKSIVGSTPREYRNKAINNTKI